MYGQGSNGKSTFQTAINSVFGPYARGFPIETIMAKKHDAQTNDLAMLATARLAHTSEGNEERKLDEGRIKKLTGGEEIQARFLYREFFSFVPQFKIWIATNAKPTITAQNDAIWRRVRLIPFEVRISEKERNRDIDNVLAAEKAGILAWAVRGAHLWLKEGLNPPDKVLAATQDYRDEEDELSPFFDSRCKVESGLQVMKGKLYTSFIGFQTLELGVRPSEVMTAKKFGMRMMEKGFKSANDRQGKRLWVGIGLNADQPDA
jgi:putative DNA primase/helicase